jgi:CheY-like chemotaxis protein
LRGDGGRVRQVLTNLIGNAIKFTGKGEVKVRVSLAEPDVSWSGHENRTLIRFEVSDTGIGISEAVQGRLFQAFTQADGSTTRKYGGSGLGLAICRRLVALMEGKIGMTSELGKGSTFWFILPFEQPRESREVDEQIVELAGVRVLVVDDVESNRTIVQHYLTAWQMKADSVDNGLQAIAAIREAARNGRPYRMVVLDYGMEGMNGIDVARIIKWDPKLASTPVIMLTSYDERNDVRAAKDAGVLAYLTKPARKLHLRKAVLGALASSPVRRDNERSPNEEKAEVWPASAKLLLVEDNCDNQKLAVRLLQKHGFRCDIASNGIEALARVAAETYPLILMDCQMPEMDGFEATAAIRKRESPQLRIAIVAMTAHALAGDRERCLAAGMDDYLSKPINEAELVNIIKRWLAAGERAVQAASGSTQAPSPAAAAAAAKRIVVTAKAGLEDLIPNYLNNRKTDLQALAESLAKGDLDTARVIGHGMKGSGGGYGFPRITEIGASIERFAVSRSSSGILSEISNLEDYLTHIDVVYPTAS